MGNNKKTTKKSWYGFGTGLVRFWYGWGWAKTAYFTTFLKKLVRVLVRVWYGFGTVGTGKFKGAVWQKSDQKCCFLTWFVCFKRVLGEEFVLFRKASCEDFSICMKTLQSAKTFSVCKDFLSLQRRFSLRRLFSLQKMCLAYKALLLTNVFVSWINVMSWFITLKAQKNAAQEFLFPRRFRSARSRL